jgi:DNA (cytosine-5)-methyltransferase 1
MRELVVDSFAGGGGASEGIRQALGCEVDIAINHDRDAIEMHWLNHPKTQHFPQDIFSIEPIIATKGLPVGLLWMSPDCTHHSCAKGGKPIENKRRGLAGIGIIWAQQVRPRIIMLENVKEFLDWGPCTKTKMKKDNLWSEWEYVPDPTRKKEYFNRFVNRLRRLGYQVEWKVLIASDYGVATSRKRLYLIARCDGQPIVWPEKTHGPGLLPYRTAAECLDLTLPCHSIFLTKEEARKQNLNIRRPLAEATLKRIARGLEKYVINTDNPFIVPCGDEAAKASCLIKYHGGESGEGRSHSLSEPLRTQDTSNRFGLVVAFLTKFYKTNIGSDLRLPMPAITAQGQHLAAVYAYLISYYHNGTGQELNNPLRTLTTKERFALVEIRGQAYQIADIGLRMLTPRELARATGFPDTYILTGTNDKQVAKVGDAVCPEMARLLVAANVTLRELESVKVG